MTAPFCPTPEQQAVIESQHGTLLVLAAVGSGKTTTLSHRVARALQDGVKAHELLALTFTNRAADHMREALAKAVGARVASQVTLSTFHALCNRILRQHAERAGLPTDFRILDEDDAEELMRELGMDQPRKALYAIHADASAVPLGEASVELWATGGFSPRGDARIYVEALGERGAVDFAGLVLLTRALLLRDADCRALWGDRFSSVLVDEVQDTHLSEYEVLSVLAANARSFCLVGDLDQTIYGWRGSAPQTLLARLDRDFGPVHKLELTANFRATRALLAVADRLAEGLSNRVSHVLAPDGADQGERPTLHAYATEAEEHAAIARSMGARLAAGADARQLAVLVRTNQQVGDVGQAFAEQGVPATTVEQFRFYRRAEIKDALALARLVYDRGDEQAARRVARRLVRGVGERTVRRILDEAATCGLRLADLLNQRAVDEGDPLWGLGTPDVVVLDTETTGIQAGRDEVIEVAAQRLRGGRISPASHDRMAALLKNTQPLGDSEAVHGISQERLDVEGRHPADVLGELKRFIGQTPIAGHNVRFDVAMLEAAGRKHGVPLHLCVAWDSLDVARRLIRTERYTLEHLVAHLQIPFQPTHRALDDVLATASLAARLAPLAARHAAERRALMLREAPLFARLRQTLDRWAAEDLRPAQLIARITEEALKHKYPKEPWRLDNLAELVERMTQLDDADLPAATALSRALDRAALVRDVDQLDEAAGVRVITMHQSKGLEFDAVWVPGLTEGGLPSWFATQDGSTAKLDEERRVLYVAITRARRALDLSWAGRDRSNRAQRPSSFLEDLRELCILDEDAP